MAWGMTVAPTIPTARSTLSVPWKLGMNPSSDPFADGPIFSTS